MDRKQFFPNRLLSPIVLITIVIVAVSAVAVALYQVNKGPVAPNAPQSLPKAAEQIVSGCTLNFTVPSATTGLLNCTKRAFQDELDNVAGTYHLRHEIQTVKAGDIVVFNLDMENTGTDSMIVHLNDLFTVAPSLSNALTFIDSNCPGGGVFDANTMTLTCSNKFVGGGQNQQITFRVQVNPAATIGTSINNSATVSDDVNTAICTRSITVAEATTQKPCNATCETSKECSGTLECVNVGGVFVCRDPQIPNDSTCGAPTPTPTSTNTPTLTPSLTPTGTLQPTNTPTNTATPTHTATPTFTSTPTHTPTSTPTFTPTRTPTNTLTPSATPTGTLTPTQTPTATFTPSATPTFTLTLTPSATPTLNPSITASLTPTTKVLAGCNQSCSVNADCNDSAAICVSTSTGNRCRLANNVNSDTCTSTNASITNTPFIPQLPRAGSENQRTLIIGGVIVVAIIIGVVGLLLLL